MADRAHDRRRRARHRAGDGGGAAGRRGGGRRRGRARQGRRSRPGAPAPGDRSALLHGLADALEEHLEDLARLEARNVGKPISDARGEMGWWCRPSATTRARRSACSGHTIPVAGGVDMTFREPLGVVGLIVPWNFPLTIASGRWRRRSPRATPWCSSRPSLTPLTALELERIALEAGPPRGRAERGRRARQRVRAAAGRAPRRGEDRVHRLDRGRARHRGAGAAGTIKRVTLELGGKSANVVFADADLERRRRGACAVFGNAGQDCCARSRILVERSIAGPLHGGARGGGGGDGSATRSTSGPRWGR